jgi:hypothetical protein
VWRAFCIHIKTFIQCWVDIRIIIFFNIHWFRFLFLFFSPLIIPY